MSIRSMTGFARVQKSSAEGEAVVTLKSVNHRGLDVHFHLPEELAGCESSLRTVIKRSALRGHFQVRAAFTRLNPSAGALNQGLLQAYVDAFRQASSDLKLPGEPDLNVALGLPGMLSQPFDQEPGQAAEQLLVAAMEEAMTALNAFREREGAELAAEARARAAVVQSACARMQQLRAGALPAFQARLEERMAELLRGVALDPQRLAQEAAILADRSDIEEELTRLRVHASELLKILEEGGETGKKLDFLLQEMAREANTILSKTGGLGDLGLGITAIALEAKAEIEKLREQAQNLE
jgi:uncharacterized protein (TIGR00255 family)